MPQYKRARAIAGRVVDSKWSLQITWADGWAFGVDRRWYDFGIGAIACGPIVAIVTWPIG